MNAQLTHKDHLDALNDAAMEAMRGAAIAAQKAIDAYCALHGLDPTGYELHADDEATVRIAE